MIDTKRIETIAAVAALLLVIAGCLEVLAPFLSTLLWVVVICYSTWGVYERLLALLRNRSALAAALMTLLIATVIVGPFVIVGMTIGKDADSLGQALHRFAAQDMSKPPEWVGGLPLVGPKLVALWPSQETFATRLPERLRDLAAPAGKWLLGAGLAFGTGLAQLCLGVLASYFLYRDGAAVAAHLRAGTARIAGARSQHFLEVAGSTVKGVVYGILGSAFAQGILGGLGYWVAGVPGPFLLGLLTAFLALIPMGPPLIWVPATLWLFHQGETGWAIFMGVWGVLAISSIDNIVKPYLISQGSALPFILVLLGVLGGMLAYGVAGVFLGPTLLAVGYALVTDWTRIQAQAETSDASGAAAVSAGGQPTSPEEIGAQGR
jgi:predicted PurR-regulated permease PerM